MMRDPLAWIPVRYKLPLTFVFFCLVAFVLGGYLVTNQASDSLREQLEMRLSERAHTLGLVVDRSLELHGRRVQDFASDGHIRLQFERLLAGSLDPRDDAALRAELIRHLRENKLPLVDAFADAFLVDTAGRALLAGHGTRLPVESGFDREALWFGPLRGAQASFPHPSFVISTPVDALQGGGRLGYLQLLVRADRWAAGIETDLEFPGATGFTARLGDADGFTLPLTAVPEGDAPRIALAQTVPRTGWTLDLAVDAAFLSVPLETLLRRMFYVGLGLALLTLAMLLFPQQFLLRPLSALQDAARRIADGDFSARVDYRSRDEVGELAGAFNLMASAIEERTRRLEQTARRLERREEEIRFERDRLSAVIRSMEDGLFILGADGRVTLSNAAARPVIESMSEARSAGACTRHAAGVESCLGCVADFANDVQGCVINVGPRTYEINGAVLSGPGEAIVGKVFVSRDVTERLRQSEQQAHQERLAVLGEIAAVMAHELNNPLAAISMFSQMLRNGLDLGSREQSHAEVIHRNTESCKATIRTLLDMASSSSAEFDELDVADLVQDVTELLEPVAQRAGAGVHRGAQAADGRAFGEELQLRQALVNLVMNAIQALRGVQGGRVTVETRDRGDEVAIVVRDNGPGIPAEIRGQIFEPFYTTKPPGEGTGLGLPTSRRIVETHGGRLVLLDSRPGHTAFEIVVPRRRRPAVPAIRMVGTEVR